jgi:peptide/nickel transport system permease protein
MATPRLAERLSGRQAKARADKRRDISQIPQWRLMVRRFMQSKLSVFGLIVLAIMYVIALFAPFFAPYQYDQIDSNYQWAAPSEIGFVSSGLAMCGVSQRLDEVNFTWEYTTDCSQAVPIRFFVRGYEWQVLGLFPSTLHLFGVDAQEATAEVPADPTAPVPVPAKVYLWGADSQGRDLFSRVLQGSRVSLSVGLVGVIIATILGSIIGTASGYFGGAIDNVMQRIIELIQSMPTLPLYAAIAAALPRETTVTQRFLLITIVLSLINWTGLARQVRGKVLGYRSADYTSAARLAGASHSRIITSHMVPNAMSHIIVVAALAVPGAILGETALSFLGLGMLPPAVSWGVLLRDAQQVQTVTTYPWLMIPGAAVILAVLCCNLLGDGLRDAVDPYG